MLLPKHTTNAKRGEFIDAKGLTFIASGVAISTKTTDTCYETISAGIYQENDWHGGYECFMGLKTWRLYALTDTVALHFHVDHFLEQYGIEKLMELVAKDTERFEAAFLRMATWPVDDRIHHAVTSVGESIKKSKGVDTLTFRLNRDMLAALSGVHPETCSRNITSLVKAGRLNGSHSTFTV
jgi:CRP-like cAMP-binding protein